MVLQSCYVVFFSDVEVFSVPSGLSVKNYAYFCKISESEGSIQARWWPHDVFSEE